MEQYADIVKLHLPFGYKIVRKYIKDAHGYVTSDSREIVVSSQLVSRYALFVFLHECGHLHSKHILHHYSSVPAWMGEYEADDYAIQAMKEHKIAIPRDLLSDQKEELRRLIKLAISTGETEFPIAVLKYAFGKTWRQYR